MSIANVSKDRLNTSEFLELIPHLSLEDLLLIEFYSDVWRLLISMETNKRLACSLCKVKQLTMKSIYIHMEDKLHTTNLKLVELFHPEYTNSKKTLQTRVSREETDSSLKENEHNKPNLTKNTAKNSNENSSVKLIKCVDLSKLVATKANLPSHQETIELSDNEPSPKKRKINTCGELHNTGDTFKSNYQVNRIIIPSIYKNSQQNKNETFFAVKKFCSKPFENIVGLIGVEYVIKIIKTPPSRPPKYECCLCKLHLDGPAMQNHLVGYNHRLNYCEKHFSSAVHQFKKYLNSLPEYEVYKVMIPILEKLAIAIEEHHGRKLPYECSEATYMTKREEIVSKALSIRHASEESGPSFLHILSAKEIDYFIETRNNCISHSASHPLLKSYTSNAYYNLQQHIHHPVPLDNETHKRMVDNFLQQNSRRSKNNEYIQNDGIAVTASSNKNFLHDEQNGEKNQLDLKMYNNASTSTNHFIGESNIEELNKQYEVYRQDPEKHPMYSKEWQLFWRRRKDELIAEGLDYHTYNYQVEWIQFFKDRLEELYNDSMEQIKHESLKKYYGRHRKNNCKDKKTRDSQSDEEFTDSHKQIDKSPKVIAVLRYMTALEDQLGSLGPKIIELLSKALQIEKTKPEEINNIILTKENCSLLQTCKEKFKGLVIAGLLEKVKERALKTSIEEIEDLLAATEIEKEKKIKHTKDIPIVSNTMTRKSASGKTENNEGLISLLLAHTNKKELASRLASTLMEQGRTDINPDQLQQLIAVYTVLERKKREAALTVVQTSSSDTFSAGFNSKGTKTIDMQTSLDSSSNSNSGDYSNRIIHQPQDSVNNAAIALNPNLISNVSNTSNKDLRTSVGRFSNKLPESNNNRNAYSLSNVPTPNVTGTPNFNNAHNNNNIPQMTYRNLLLNHHQRLNDNTHHFQAPRQMDSSRNRHYYPNHRFGGSER